MGDGDKLYGSVTTSNIGDAMEAAGIDIDRRKILLAEPIRSLGEYDIEIRLHPDVMGELKLAVVRHGGPIVEEIEEPAEKAEAVEESVANAEDAETQRPRSGQYADNPEEALDRASSDLLRKVPPHSLEAEQAVLGGVFQSEHMFHQLVDIIGPDDFYSPVHRDIFKSFVQLYDDHQPIDVITVANQLAKNDTLDTVGGPVYLAELSDSVVSASNALHHAQIVRDKCILRELIDISSGIISNCFSSRDVGEVLDESEKEIFRIANPRRCAA